MGNWFPSETVSTRGVLLTTIPRWFPEWSVELEIKITGPPLDDWTTVLHLTGDGDDCCNAESRMPLIHLHANDNRPFICSYVSGEPNKGFRLGC